ncbi:MULTISPECIES: acyl-CoA dehydrogenase family protein [unclassified Streptomyces]|uniref:acyl-CoA dehydrogenase family protein n=1 Tax=unclassified Streptomyces TaxID=2593676 RepID=UPI00168A8037|nr:MULTISPECIES: acyl-CoA dehydrogenase family protein [unclassified Streptomyces]MBD3007596.1 acyl-CoA dehydrogenase family protein [Streptomyces sp. 5-10]
MTTHDALVARAVALQPLLREHAMATETDRRVPDEVIDALAEAGLLKLSVPKRYGGHQTSLRTMLDVSAALAEGDGSTSWVVTLVNVCNWLTSLFPSKAQDDVFGANPDARVTGVLTPTSTSVKVDGGWRVSGRWYYNSGSSHSDWAALGVPLTDEEGEIVDQALLLAPREDLSLEDTWFVAGMKGTASNCLVAEDIFVPEHRVMSIPAATEGDYPTEHKDEVLSRSALVPVLALVLAGPQLGLGRAALKYVTEKAARKPISYTFYETQAESVAVQMQIAEAALRIDTAILHAQRAAAQIDQAAQDGTYLSFTERARVRADTGWVIQNVLEAINTLVSVHGAASFAEVNPLQRIWRDANTAGRHAVAAPTVAMEVYGKALLGVEEKITPLV